MCAYNFWQVLWVVLCVEVESCLALFLKMCLSHDLLIGADRC